MKKLLLVSLAVIAAFLAYIAFTPLEPVLYQNTYYGKLKAACGTDQLCCVESVKRMEAQGYHLAKEKATDSDNYDCPAEFSRNALKCLGSYTWCEPNPN